MIIIALKRIVSVDIMTVLKYSTTISAVISTLYEVQILIDAFNVDETDN